MFASHCFMLGNDWMLFGIFLGLVWQCFG